MSQGFVDRDVISFSKWIIIKTSRGGNEVTMYQTIIVEKKNGVAKITLNRPAQMNAMTYELIREVKSALEDAEHDGTVKVVTITGAGRAFCAGGDLDYFLATQHSAEFYEFSDTFDQILNGIQYGKKIVIAAVNGYCLAGGFEIISACDYVIASENAILGDEHINRGLIAGGFSVYRWGKILGIRRAKEILLTGKRYTAKEAEEIGIINKVVPADRLDEAAYEMAKTFADKNQEALSLSKQALNRAGDIDLRTLYDTSSLRFQVNFTRLVGSGGVKAFVEKEGK